MPGPVPLPGRCQRCWLRTASCLCSDIPRVANRTEIVVVRHTLERKKVSNTGRLAALALDRCRLVTFGAHDEELPDEVFEGPDTWLLYPEGPPLTAAPAPAPRRLLVLDATWSQARRMRARLPGVRGMSILSLPPPPPRRRMRIAPRENTMATLESIAHALALLEGPALRDPLLSLYDLLVERAAFPGRRWIE